MTRVRLLGHLGQHNDSEEDNAKQQSIESSGSDRKTTTGSEDNYSTTTSTTIGGGGHIKMYEMDGVHGILHSPHLQQQPRLSPAYQASTNSPPSFLSIHQQQQQQHPILSQPILHQNQQQQQQQLQQQQQQHVQNQQTQIQYLSPMIRPSATTSTTFIDDASNAGMFRTVSPVAVSASGIPLIGGASSLLTAYPQSPSHASLQPTTGLVQGTTGIPPSQTYSAIVYQPVMGGMGAGQPFTHPQPMLVVGDPSIPLSTMPSLFHDRQIKMDYIRKVLVLLFTIIGLSFLIINIFNFRTIKEWVQDNSWFVIVSLISSILIIVMLTCLADSGQDCPANVFLTWMFTVSASLTIGASTCFSFFESLQLIYLFDVTLIMIFALLFSLILYAFQINYDFNMRNCISYVILIVVVFVVIYLVLILAWGYWLALFLPTVLFAATGGLAYTLYVIYDIICMIQRCYLNGVTPGSVMLAVIYIHTDFFNCYGNFWQSC